MATHGTQEQLLLFSITGNPRAGVFCWSLFRMLLKENEEIDLDPCNLWIQLGNQDQNSLQFSTASLKVIPPFPIRGKNFRYHSLKLSHISVYKLTVYITINCVDIHKLSVYIKDCNTTQPRSFGVTVTMRGALGRQGIFQRCFSSSSLETKRKRKETNHTNNTREIARLPGNICPGLGYNKFMLDSFE